MSKIKTKQPTPEERNVVLAGESIFNAVHEESKRLHRKKDLKQEAYEMEVQLNLLWSVADAQQKKFMQHFKDENNFLT